MNWANWRRPTGSASCRSSTRKRTRKPAGIVPVEIEGDFSGDYLQLARFINALERSKLFYMVDSVGLAGESTGPVKLEVKLHSYLKAGA